MPLLLRNERVAGVNAIRAILSRHEEVAGAASEGGEEGSRGCFDVPNWFASLCCLRVERFLKRRISRDGAH